MFIRHSIDVVTDIADVAQMTITGERASASADGQPTSR
jgi:hypothetical protein